MQKVFTPADILLPDFGKISPEKWSVIACDQFTGDPAYWEQTAALTEGQPSALDLILPEVYLEKTDVQERIDSIHANMQKYLQEGVFRRYPDALIYVERVQKDGILRTGIIGKIDLEAYDYTSGSQSPVRATEATVLERIPPRMKVRAKAALELPHIMILIDDPADAALGVCAAEKSSMQQLYQTELMQGGGSITGYLLTQEQQQRFLQQLDAVAEQSGTLQFAMGDGNHSLATAKACYEQLKQAHPGEDLSAHPARYALAEIVNLHSEALQFEAIHRIVMQVQPEELVQYLTETLELSAEPSAQPVTIVRNGQEQTLYIHRMTSNLAVGSLQNALDAYLTEHAGKVDYIHGTATVRKLAEKPDAVGFLLPDMDKRDLFPSVQKDGALPRKTFSMGHAEDKRYYMEARRIEYPSV